MDPRTIFSENEKEKTEMKQNRKGFTLIELLIVLAVLGVIAALVMGGVRGCNWSNPQSASGVSKATVKIPTGADGLTAEQRNVEQRLLEDNKPGAIKHLYVVSAYSGQTILYSTVKGKVTSGGKRLTPTTLSGSSSDGHVSSCSSHQDVSIGGTTKTTTEVLQDDGTYGSSMEYLFWWDANGVYCQTYVVGGTLVFVSSQPRTFGSVTMNVETKPAEGSPAEKPR